MSSTFYQQYPKFHVAVDCIIFGFKNGLLKVLLQQRPFEPHAGEWSLMGGFVNSDEDVDDAAARVLTELTGLKNVYMKQVGAFGSVNRDSGDRVISVAYFALLDIDRVDKERNREHSAYWEDLSTLPKLLFDHKEMVQRALTMLRERVSKRPVGFQLLPPLFTLTQLQMLYEAIIGENIDKRNFRKRVAEMTFIEKTDEIDKRTSKRGAALYRFNNTAYQRDGHFKL
jgi:ADP-ribose pyrophosphatase YjhB (NUDIX family)